MRLGIPALPIGTLEDIEFSVGETLVEMGSRLYIYSDGVYEVVLTNGAEMALEDFIPLVAIQPPPTLGLESVRAAVAGMQGRDRFDDDFSLVELTFN